MRVFRAAGHDTGVGYRPGRLTGLLVLPALLATLPIHAAAIIQLRVVEGEGAVYAIGSRATRGLTIQVTDETGKPVEAAAVSFRLPEDGPGGVFGTGLRTEVVTTRADGRATVWGMKWNRTPGAFEIRVTAARDQARAGIVVGQYLSDKVAPGAGGTGEFHASHSWHKWMVVGAAAGGGALAVMAFSKRAAASSSSSTTPETQPPQIGTPIVTIGLHP
jgi:hypothetical protein